MMTIALLAAPLALASVEFCSAAPDPPATAPPEWHWRMVDGKKCYFRAAKLPPTLESRMPFPMARCNGRRNVGGSRFC